MCQIWLARSLVRSVDHRMGQNHDQLVALVQVTNHIHETRVSFGIRNKRGRVTKVDGCRNQAGGKTSI